LAIDSRIRIVVPLVSVPATLHQALSRRMATPTSLAGINAIEFELRGAPGAIQYPP